MKKSFSIGVLGTLVLFAAVRVASAQAPNPASNLSQPISNLSSPRFGESTSTGGSFGFGPSGSAAAGNRRIHLQVRFSFSISKESSAIFERVSTTSR